MVILKEHRSSSGTIEDSLECRILTSDYKLENGRHFKPEIEVLDLKRDYLLSNFFYVSLRLKFEGFNEDLEQELN